MTKFATLSRLNVELLRAQRRASSFFRAICVTVFVVLVGCDRESGKQKRTTAASFTERAQLAEFASNGVSVKVALETDANLQPILRATFTPDSPGFHVYSKDLPERGVNGFGAPTRFVVATNAGIPSVGNAFADVMPKDLHVKALGVTLAIYPEGPVNICVPIELRSAEQDVDAQLSFSYMACDTKGVCLRAIDGKKVTVKIPKL